MYFLPVQNNNINNKKINDITKAFIINKNARTDRVQSTRLVLSLPLTIPFQPKIPTNSLEIKPNNTTDGNQQHQHQMQILSKKSQLIKVNKLIF